LLEGVATASLLGYWSLGRQRVSIIGVFGVHLR
jgi:hypothetical protein